MVAAAIAIPLAGIFARRTRMRSLLLSLVLACQTNEPLVRPYANDLFVTAGVEYVHAELKARSFCRERGQPIMRPVDKVEQTVHVTGTPQIKEIKLIFRCEGGDVPDEQR